jgi:hypothetical protein
MKNTYFIIFLWLISHSTFCQDELDKATDAIVKEGHELYYLEKASWVATDILKEDYPKKYEDIGGYCSYSNDGFFVCVFFQKYYSSVATFTVTFDSTFNRSIADVDTIHRKLTPFELDLFEIRRNALKEVGKGEVIKHYKNAGFNPIPIIKGSLKKVYIMTAIPLKGYMVLGNDYILQFKKNGKLKSIEALHEGILVYQEDKLPYDGDMRISWHEHGPGYDPLLTVTDVCTLLLYGEKSEAWHHHFVFSDNYVCIWDYNARGFVVMTQEAFNRTD